MGGGYLTPLQPIYLLQKRAVLLIAGFHYLYRTPRLFESFGSLTGFDLYKLQLGVCMYSHQIHDWPPIFDDYFRTNASVHDLFTRSQSGRHAVSCKTNVLLDWLGLNYGTSH